MSVCTRASRTAGTAIRMAPTKGTKFSRKASSAQRTAKSRPRYQSQIQMKNAVARLARVLITMYWLMEDSIF